MVVSFVRFALWKIDGEGWLLQYGVTMLARIIICPCQGDVKSLFAFLSPFTKMIGSPGLEVNNVGVNNRLKSIPSIVFVVYL